MLHNIWSSLKTWDKSDMIALGALIISIFSVVQGCVNSDKLTVLEPQINQVINLQPKIENHFNAITEIRHEIVDIHMALAQMDALRTTEIFMESDLGTRIKTIERPENLDSQRYSSYLIFQLKEVPLPNSVDISDSIRGSTSRAVFEVTRNVIQVRMENVKDVFNDIVKWYSITYTPDKDFNDELLTLDEMTFEYGEDGFKSWLKKIKSK